MNPLMAYFFTVLLLIVLVGAWILLGWLSALMGGWHRLASRYRFTQNFEGKLFPTRSAMMGMTRYSNCITMGVNTQGLYLNVFVWMRLNHPPLFIPWEDMVGKVEQTWLAPILLLSFKPFPRITIELPLNTAMELKAAAQNPMAFPEIVA